MLTPAEYLKNGIPDNHELWLNGLDLVSHCLKRDLNQTFFKKENRAVRHWEPWTEAMQERAKNTDNFQDIYNNSYTPRKQWQSTYDDCGCFDTGAFIAGEDFCFEDERRTYEQGDSVSVILDTSIPYSQRGDTHMETRHQKVYDLIAQCDSEDRPIQVVGCFCLGIDECREPLKIFTMIKDYTDTIFPAIWGSLINNKSTNEFQNVIMNYFIGTGTYGNGTITNISKAEQYFPMNEELYIFGTRIKSDNATIIKD